MKRDDYGHASRQFRQKGAATLLTAVVLSISAVLVALTVTETTIVEQQITANDIRAQEVFQGAEALLDFGVAWAQANSLPASAAESSGAVCYPPTSGETSSAGCPTPSLASVGLTTNDSSGEVYTYKLTFFEDGDVTRVETEVWAKGAGSNISASTESYFVQDKSSIFNSGTPSPPPFVLNGCFQSGTKNGSVTLLNNNNESIINANCSASQIGGIAKQVSGGGSDGVHKIGNFSCGSPLCVWNHYFSMDITSAKADAISGGYEYDGKNIHCGDAINTFYYINGNESQIQTNNCGPGGSVGTASKPVILIVDSQSGSCPKINGGATIYGIVYIDGSCTSAGGWGGGKIHGTLMVEGDSTQPAANSTEYYEVDFGGNDISTGGYWNTQIVDAPRIPGTWKDF